jgi:hypothetical protein
MRLLVELLVRLLVELLVRLLVNIFVELLALPLSRSASAARARVL